MEDQARDASRHSSNVAGVERSNTDLSFSAESLDELILRKAKEMSSASIDKALEMVFRQALPSEQPKQQIEVPEPTPPKRDVPSSPLSSVPKEAVPQPSSETNKAARVDEAREADQAALDDAAERAEIEALKSMFKDGPPSMRRGKARTSSLAS